MTKTVRNRIEELKDEIAKLEAEENKLKTLSETQQLAIRMHNLMCRSNHTDGCGWQYCDDYKADTWESEYAHKQWFEHAKKLIDFCKINGISTSLAMDLAELAKGW